MVAERLSVVISSIKPSALLLALTAWDMEAWSVERGACRPVLVLLPCTDGRCEAGRDLDGKSLGKEQPVLPQHTQARRCQIPSWLAHRPCCTPQTLRQLGAFSTAGRRRAGKTLAVAASSIEESGLGRSRSFASDLLLHAFMKCSASASHQSTSTPRHRQPERMTKKSPLKHFRASRSRLSSLRMLCLPVPPPGLLASRPLAFRNSFCSWVSVR
jgi:hypothetical protein